MSRHHHRFERDYRSSWERRERPAALHNGVTNNACTPTGPTLTNGNNRPGLLPLPVIPSLLPTPVTIAVTTSSNELGAKRAGAAVTAPTVKCCSAVSPKRSFLPGLSLLSSDGRFEKES
ncbi:Kelch-like protein 29 [Bagarius yarrelli]|uniref:Kelch-like protein 29 n=1 Tax=Bagarius yarrelli TaxID=175774 RepID=A0A556TSP6_BAGYA|nr:Kelch-like protein 29 [Bagarius yarrelli]